MSASDVYNRTRLRNLKRAKLKFLESQLALYKKQGVDERLICETLRSIDYVRWELDNLK